MFSQAANTRSNKKMTQKGNNRTMNPFQQMDITNTYQNGLPIDMKQKNKKRIAKKEDKENSVNLIGVGSKRKRPTKAIKSDKQDVQQPSMMFGLFSAISSPQNIDQAYGKSKIPAPQNFKEKQDFETQDDSSIFKTEIGLNSALDTDEHTSFHEQSIKREYVTRSQQKRQKLNEPIQTQTAQFKMIPAWLKSISSSISSAIYGSKDQGSPKCTTYPIVMPAERQSIEPSIPQSQKLMWNKKCTPRFDRKTFMPNPIKEYSEEMLPEPTDFLDLEIQNLRAYRDMNGSMLDHGHYEINEEVRTRLQYNPSGLGESGISLQFPVYEDKDLHMLCQDTPICNKINRCIVQAEFDDDCATDEEMMSNAVRMLNRDLAKGIDKYEHCKKQGSLSQYIKNDDPKKRFHQLNPNEDSDEE